MSKLQEAGDAASRKVRRRILLRELERTGWNLAHVSDRLWMGGPSKVLQAIRALGLEADYAAAKASGRAKGKARKTRARVDSDD